MAIIFADGFDHYGTGSPGLANMLAGAWGFFNYTSISSTQKRTGSYSIKQSGSTNGDRMRKSFTSGNNEVGVSFGFFLDSLPATDDMTFKFRNNSADIATVALSPAGGFILTLGGAGGTVIGASDSGIITASAFHHIEMRLLRDNVVGEFEIKFNGITVMSVTDINFGASNPNVFASRLEQSNGVPDIYIDDFIIWDSTGDVNNTFLGPARITTGFVTADTAQADWAKSAGSDGYAMIDEVAPDGDTTFISSDTAGNKSDFALFNLPDEIFTVQAVYVPTMAKLAAAGIGNMKTSMVSGASVASGPDTPLTTAYTYWPSVFEKDPATGATWTRAAVEAANVRVEKTV